MFFNWTTVSDNFRLDNLLQLPILSWISAFGAVVWLQFYWHVSEHLLL